MGCFIKSLKPRRFLKDLSPVKYNRPDGYIIETEEKETPVVEEVTEPQDNTNATEPEVTTPGSDDNSNDNVTEPEDTGDNTPPEDDPKEE